MNSEKKLAIIQEDPWLAPHEGEIEARLERFKKAYKDIKRSSGSLIDFATAHQYYGVHFDNEKKGWFYREWAPYAHQLFLMGDFNDWDRSSHKMYRNHFGDWEIFLPFEEYQKRFTHKSRIKVHIVADNGALDRIPVYITRVIQDPETHDFSGQLWFPRDEFQWTDKKFKLKRVKPLLIYEAHVGMSQEKEGVGTYKEFADRILPRIKQGGYTAVQLMAVQEHPYYGSFGYHVSNFFAPASRFGTPEDLKYLVNKAHKMGLAVIMDVVHSHAVKNIAEGLDQFDGTDHQYFHPGPRGYHEAWDSKLFDYGKWEVKRFLLSNLRYWLEEFHFDGFRFDGVTSLLYFHHGYTTFDNYDKYYKEGVDWDALTYLQLANELVHRFKKHSLSIAEDVSGMPGLTRKPKEGGVGFDYRLGMGIPDYWIKMLKEKRDEDWNIHEIYDVLSNRRWKERTISYAESHDQAMVGDKTLAFWLMDKEMYEKMMIGDQSALIDRGIALHKILRLITVSMGGDAYLNFMGNEFGHPEWIDFPRIGNNWSYKYARRQWSLVDDPRLKYQYLAAFDEAMLNVIRKYHILDEQRVEQLNMDASNNVIIFERNDLIFIFNLSVGSSIFDYRFKAHRPGTYRIVLNSDDATYGGFDRVDDLIDYSTDEQGTLSLYVTNRTALVLKRVTADDEKEEWADNDEDDEEDDNDTDNENENDGMED